MLISFSFGNYRSFSERTKFSMIAGQSKRHADHLIKVSEANVLKSAIIYGANAAGKSSIIMAMEDSQNIVLGGDLRNYSNNYCRCNDEYRTKPTVFEYIFKDNDKYFRFGFETVLSENKFISEWLYTVENGKIHSPIYAAELKNGEYVYEYSDISDSGKELLNAFSSSLCVDHEKLLLTEIGSRKFKDKPELEIFHRVYNWFSNKLYIGVMKNIETDEELAKVSKHLSRYDTDVVSAKYVLDENAEFNKQDIDQLKKILKEKEYLQGPGYKITLENGSLKVHTIHTKHNWNNMEFSFHEESNGTQLAFLLCSTLFENNIEDSTIILDEFGTSMHPILIKNVMMDYLKTCKTTNNQLIVATHHTDLMTLDLFRKDEIWFVEKKSGKSEIYSLDDFDSNDRIDTHLQKAYLEGRFGALPLCRELNNEQ